MSKLSLLRLLVAFTLAGGISRSRAVAAPAEPAPAAAAALVRGVIVDRASGQPVQFAAVSVRAGTRVVGTTASDAKGGFELEGLAPGDYRLAYGLVGSDSPETIRFSIAAAATPVNLGRLELGASAVQLEKLEVSAQRQAFYNSIDRKTYNVGKDIQSATGSASDLLQNVPSVQVDIEGNVSLRGDSNVLILVNGKTSSMMGRNRAAVLEQMPADGIERIEVITNPSAKYKPDGTAGIINLVLKQKQDPGYSGSARVAVGNNRRYNASVTANLNPGRYNVYGTAAVRQDDRPRTVHDDRSHLTDAGARLMTQQTTSEKARPLSEIVQTGVDYNFDDKTKAGASVRYNHRDYVRHSTVQNLSRDGGGLVTSDYDRLRLDPEFEKDLEFTGQFRRGFANPDQELSVELRHGRTTEQEDNHYTNVYRVPAIASAQDATLIRNTETNTEGTADYAHPFGDEAKLETGYSGQGNRVDLDFRGSTLDPASQTWQPDAARTNRFIYDARIHAFYATFAEKFGRFGFLAGGRFETARIDTHQLTTHLLDRNQYNQLYPSLHLTFDLTETQQLQLNYSHRVHRPEGDDLNPFPEYQDPFNLRAGNPHLRPEDIHSLESGWQYRKDDTTYLATVYYRYRYHGMTEVTRYIDATTLLTTKENLGTSRSGGLELGATTRIRQTVSLNLSGNVYRNEIDASNLGFSARRSTTAWDAKLNANWDVSKTTLLQLNTNYTAKRLTPQGYRYPTFVANLGLRHTFKDKKLAGIVSVSDVFNSLKERTNIDTPALHEDLVRHRSTRIVYVGVIYTFGKPPKRKDDSLQYDNQL